MPELLFEVYSEEIPSEMQKYGAKKLYNLIRVELKELFDQEFTGEYFFTPRRIGFYIANIPKTLSGKFEEIRGPRIIAPEQAINGFLKKYRISDIVKLIKKGEYYFYVKKLKVQNTNKLLKILLGKIISSFHWPKSMKWGSYQIRWVRPIHSILSVYDYEIIPMIYGHIIGNDVTNGHWILDSKKIKVNFFKEYKTKLQEAGVYILHDQRVNSIINQVEKICERLNIYMIEDKKLLNKVANLVENPYVAIGAIDVKFMKLPKEVLITTLKFHQKYLMTEYKDRKLAPYFIIVSNVMTDDNLKTIIAGNEKVLKARLADAEFFYEQDISSKLTEKSLKLKQITFHHEVGSYYDKIQKIQKVAVNIANQLQVDRKRVEYTALLIKTDLVTEMVKELPELQGIAGYYYALKDGESEDIANAIKEHYLPQSPSDPVPSAQLSIIIALADKMVTLNSMFEINIKPTGSKDPFALRRAAIGIIRIICTHHLKLNLKDLLRIDVIDFILDRVGILGLEGKNIYSIDLKYIKEAL